MASGLCTTRFGIFAEYVGVCGVTEYTIWEIAAPSLAQVRTLAAVNIGYLIWPFVSLRLMVAF